MDRKELQELSRVRLREARALLSLGFWDGAYYLAGYAVECGLKACIAKATRRHEFPDRKKVESSYSHSLGDLVKVAGLDDARSKLARADPVFDQNWKLVGVWSEQSRYRRHSRTTADQLLGAIRDRQHGVMPWIRAHW